MNGRNYITLGLLSVGTADPIAGSRDQGFSAGGQRLSANNYLLDGADNNSYELADAGRMGGMVAPSVDAVQEFKVQTNSYSAEYGRGTGAVINVTIKSGSNQIHGTGYEFLRNNDMDAKNFFASLQPAIPAQPIRLRRGRTHHQEQDLHLWRLGANQYPAGPERRQHHSYSRGKKRQFLPGERKRSPILSAARSFRAILFPPA